MRKRDLVILLLAFAVAVTVAVVAVDPAKVAAVAAKQ